MYRLVGEKYISNDGAAETSSDIVLIGGFAGHAIGSDFG
jgi:hypothetical protein